MKDNSIVLAVVAVCLYFGLLLYALACFEVASSNVSRNDDIGNLTERMSLLENKLKDHTHKYYDGKVK